MRRSRSFLLLLPLVAVAGVLVLLGEGGARSASSVMSPVNEAGWEGVLGVRAAVSTADRYVVVLRATSLAAEVSASGGSGSESEMRSWTRAAQSAQNQFLARMAALGGHVTTDYRYTRVFNGFSARLDPATLQLLDHDREVAGVFPVRVAYPLAAGETTGIAPTSFPGMGVPGLDGSGVTVALLDTGVDPSHPYLTDSVLPGIDVIRPGSGGVAQPNPLVPGRPERHGTELAGIVTGSDGPDGLQGVAPGASILPIRVAGWQPDAEGGYAVYSRTDQLIAGLEAAVDPDANGDTLDAARIALVGVGEPYAAFADGPLARAAAGAQALDVLVVAPAGNDGRAGPLFGSTAGPAGAPGAIAVAATDGRAAAPTVRVHVAAGLRVLFDGEVPLGGAPTWTVTAPVVAVTRIAEARGIAGLFGADRMSAVAGRAALLPRGALSDETVDEAASAGALAVLVEGALPAGAFSLDVPAGIPVVGLPEQLTAQIRELSAEGIPVVISVGAVGSEENSGGGDLAAFSSQGLAFDGGLKPELLAPGVAFPTSEPGRAETGEARYGTVSGTSVSAAIVAGAAAVLAEGRPQANAAELEGLLVGSARPVSGAPAGVAALVLDAAVQQEVAAEPATISFGGVAQGGRTVDRPLTVANVSSRRLRVTIEPRPAGGVDLTVRRKRLLLAPGTTHTVFVHADTSNVAPGARAIVGVVRLHVSGSRTVRVPWALALPDPRLDLLSRVSLEETGGRVSDATPAVLSMVVGGIVPGTEPQIRPVDLLQVELVRRGKLMGVLAQSRDLLPGRYSFGLTGRGPRGGRLRRGDYTIRVIAHPGDGTRRQVATVDYRLR
jgi:minor extracellular serine protease Vpr